MSDVFVSYASEDRDQARRVVNLLVDHGWSVWWDRTIPAGGEWAPELDHALARTRAVIVLWSSHSRASTWVRHEATIGMEKGALISILIDRTAIPHEFSAHQASDLSTWDGSPKFAEAEALLAGLTNLVPPSRLKEVRPGYDPAFLSKRVVVGLPAVTGPAVVLRYLHFTVVIHPGRRLAHYVAYNIAGKELTPVPFEVRQEWTADPLVPRSTQITVALTTRSEYHRGHLVSPMTVCWGQPDTAAASARHAMFLPNVSPQHGDVNTGSWFELEKWERRLATKHSRAIGLSGPVFSRDDTAFRGEMELEDGVVALDSFRLPRHYWKVIAVADRGSGLRVATYIVANVSRDTTGSAPTRASLAELQMATGLRFPEAFHTAKPLPDLEMSGQRLARKAR